MQLRTTRAHIDRSALAHNLGVVRAHAGGARVVAVVKADAYGHGLVPVARALVLAGVDGFAVALAEEGLALREAGISTPIIVLNGLYGNAHAEVVEAGLSPVVYDVSDARRFAALGAAVHLKVDTGMTRLGVRDVGDFLDRAGELRIDGLMTHLGSAEDDDEATHAQLDAFERAVRIVRARGHSPLLHAANSAGTLLHPRSRYDLVRTGVSLYGVRPNAASVLDLRPVMRVLTSVARVETVPAGSAVGYNATFRTQRESRIATLAIGYGDGYMRALSDRGEVVVRGTRCPVVGRISMDLTGVDVTGVEGCERGDEVVVLGAEIRAEEVARAAGTIAYEIVCSIAPRVPRVYSP